MYMGNTNMNILYGRCIYYCQTSYMRAPRRRIQIEGLPIARSLPVPSLNPQQRKCRVLHNWRHLDTDRRTTLQLAAGGQPAEPGA